MKKKRTFLVYFDVIISVFHCVFQLNWCFCYAWQEMKIGDKRNTNFQIKLVIKVHFVRVYVVRLFFQQPVTFQWGKIHNFSHWSFQINPFIISQYNNNFKHLLLLVFFFFLIFSFFHSIDFSFPSIGIAIYNFH